MRSVFRVSAFAALSVLLLAGCRRERTSEVSFVVTPDLASRTATVECKASSTGVCHFTFSSEASPSELSVKAGETASVSNITSSTGFCGEAHKSRLAKCELRAVGSTRRKETKRFRSDDPEN